MQEQTAEAGFCIRSVGDFQFVVWLVVTDGMGKREGLAVVDGRDVDAAMLELVDECLVVVGSHRGPASIAYLMIENCY